MQVLEITKDGEVKKTVLGQDVAAGQSLQYVVPAGNWFGSYPTLDWSDSCQRVQIQGHSQAESYSLVGCTVAPGFEFADFEMATRDELLRAHPGAKEAILMLTEANV